MKFSCLVPATFAVFVGLTASADTIKEPAKVWNTYCMIARTGTPLQTAVNVNFGERKQLFVVKNIEYSIFYGADYGGKYIVELRALNLQTQHQSLARTSLVDSLPNGIDLVADGLDGTFTCFSN